MAEPNSSSRPDWNLLAGGTFAAGMGFYLMLVGLHVLPPPSHSAAPLWIAFLAGLAFFFAGGAVLLRAFEGVADPEDDLPANAPFALKTIYWLSGVVAAASVSGVGTWVAFGPGTRHFTFTGPVSGPMNEGLGRSIFGIGALLSWLAVILIARATAKKIFGRKN